MNPKPNPLINVIHLPHRVDRMTLLLNEVANQTGIKGRNCLNVIHGIKTSPAFIGINRSHKLVVSLAKEYGIPYICIAEDDIRFTHPDSYQYFIDKMPKDMDFDLYLGGVYALDPLPDQSLVQVPNFTGMTLYIITERFYDTFLGCDDQAHIDQALTGLGKYLVCNPMAVLQHNGYSDNAGAEVDYSKYFINKHLYNGSDHFSKRDLSSVPV